MADVHVSVKNNSGATAVFLMDDERDAERISYLKTLQRREDLEAVSVSPVGSESEPEVRRGPGRPPKN